MVDQKLNEEKRLMDGESICATYNYMVPRDLQLPIKQNQIENRGEYTFYAFIRCVICSESGIMTSPKSIQS